MPTTETKTVKSAGGDYSSLTAYEAAEQVNLVTADKIKQAECYAFRDVPVGDGVLWDGWTTDATRYIRAYVAVGQQHTATRGTGYQLVISGFGHGGDIREDNVRMEGIALVSEAGPFYGDRGFHIDCGGSSDIRLSKIYLSTFTNDRAFCRTFNSTSGVKIWNCMSGSDGTLTDDWNTMFAGSSGTHYLYNNTVVGRIFGPFAACYTVELSATPTMVFKNNIGDRGANPDVNSAAYLLPGATTTGSSNNLSDDASAPGSNVFVNRHPLYVDETNGDLHIHSTDDSGVRNNGVDLSADANIAFSDDIDGTTRPVDNSWDLGADESAAPALPVGGSGSSIFAFDRFKTGELSSSDERKWF